MKALLLCAVVSLLPAIAAAEPQPCQSVGGCTLGRGFALRATGHGSFGDPALGLAGGEIGFIAAPAPSLDLSIAFRVGVSAGPALSPNVGLRWRFGGTDHFHAGLVVEAQLAIYPRQYFDADLVVPVPFTVGSGVMMSSLIGRRVELFYGALLELWLDVAHAQPYRYGVLDVRHGIAIDLGRAIALQLQFDFAPVLVSWYFPTFFIRGRLGIQARF